jgi:3-hydroxybutyryl-CoA dehydrogenase
MNHQKLDIEKILSAITTSTNYQSLSDVDIVIENIPEIIDAKLELYDRIKDICSKDCLFLVNTSCIPILKISEHTNSPDRVIGVHFMNPVPMQKFAEVIRSKNTSTDTITFVEEFLKSVEIGCTVVKDSPGFVTNRLSHLFMNEAANLVMEGVAEPEQIDRIFTEGFHHEMGPLHTADLIGIDTVVNSIDVLYECYKDKKFECSPYLRQMVQEGRLGRKTNKGFFEY